MFTWGYRIRTLGEPILLSFFKCRKRKNFTAFQLSFFFKFLCDVQMTTVVLFKNYNLNFRSRAKPQERRKPDRIRKRPQFLKREFGGTSNQNCIRPEKNLKKICYLRKSSHSAIKIRFLTKIPENDTKAVGCLLYTLVLLLRMEQQEIFFFFCQSVGSVSFRYNSLGPNSFLSHVSGVLQRK